jgi:hypothetical protein
MRANAGIPVWSAALDMTTVSTVELGPKPLETTLQ